MKIKTLCALVLLLLFGTSLVSAQSVTRCGGPNTGLYINWTTFQFDVCHTGYNPYENRISTANVQNLVVAWKYATRNQMTGSPVLVNGVVYFGSQDTTVYAADAVTGALRWSYITANPVFTAPAVVNGVLFIASGRSVYALNANTGTLLWKQSMPDVITTSPTVANGILYIGCNDSNMYALNTATGVHLWQYNTSQGIQSTPAVVNGVVYFGSSLGNVYALNALNGVLIWKSNIGGNIYSSPVVFNGVVYITQNIGAVFALNATTGATLWNTQPQFGGHVAMQSSPVVANGIVYVGALNTDQEMGLPTIFAFRASDGSVLWSALSLTGHTVTSLAVANNVLYAAASDGNLYTYSADAGQYLWNYTTALSYSGPPIIANGMVYIESDTKNLYAFRLANE